MDKRIFANQGIQGLMDKTKGGNHKNMIFEDEASFGRINKPKYCWCNNKFRPCVSCHYIREYRYAFGAVESLTEERFFFSYAKL